MRSLRTVTAALAVAAVVTTAAGAGAPSVHFRVFARTGLRLTDIVWTGRQFLYVDNTTNRVAAAGPSGMPLRPFAQMPRQVEETRCSPSPGAHGFAAGDLYCHSPDNKIYRISPDGKTVTVFAVLPHSSRSDGALTFDTVGAFSYALLAATGRSGAATPAGGSVFAIDPAGKVRRIGRYDTPGGADEIVVAPPSFGSASGHLLLAVDAGKSGSLVAMDGRGRARTLVTLPDGANPLAVLVPGRTPRAGAAQAGLYVTDTLSRSVFFAPASELRPFTGDVVVGTEVRGLFWVVRPRGSGFAALRLPTNLGGKKYNFEGAIYVAG
jgi:hypothetical protein